MVISYTNPYRRGGYNYPYKKDGEVFEPLALSDVLNGEGMRIDGYMEEFPLDGPDSPPVRIVLLLREPHGWMARRLVQ